MTDHTETEEIPWKGVLLVEGEQSRDGRIIALGALKWTTPFPLTDLETHAVIGRVNEVWRDGNLIRGRGISFKPVGGMNALAELKIGSYTQRFSSFEIAEAEFSGICAGDADPAFPQTKFAE